MTARGYEITDGRITAGGRAILEGIDLDLPRGAVTAVLGPSGTGKSLLLAALSGYRLPDGVELGGRWSLGGRPRARWAGGEICLVRQRSAGTGTSWRDALTEPAPVVLLDEPCRALAAGDAVEDLAAAIRAARGRATIVVVTHHVGLARAAADQVCLLCAGRIDSRGAAAAWFATPPTVLAAQMIAQGNCWPRPTLPRHFHWIVPGLAGMGRPGLLGDAGQDIAALSAAGIDHLVSLTEEPFRHDALAEHGIAQRHLAIADMGVPSLVDVAALCDEIQHIVESGGGVAVHCRAGLGRTGTVLACCLVRGGASADEAIAAVRAVQAGFIQTPEQLELVHRLAATRPRSPS